MKGGLCIRFNSTIISILAILVAPVALTLFGLEIAELHGLPITRKFNRMLNGGKCDAEWITFNETDKAFKFPAIARMIFGPRDKSYQANEVGNFDPPAYSEPRDEPAR